MRNHNLDTTNSSHKPSQNLRHKISTIRDYSRSPQCQQPDSRVNSVNRTGEVRNRLRGVRFALIETASLEWRKTKTKRKYTSSGEGRTTKRREEKKEGRVGMIYLDIVTLFSPCAEHFRQRLIRAEARETQASARGSIDSTTLLALPLGSSVRRPSASETICEWGVNRRH